MSEIVACPHCGASVNHNSIMYDDLMPDATISVHSQEPKVPSGFEKEKGYSVDPTTHYVKKDDSNLTSGYFKQKLECPKNHSFWVSGRYTVWE